MTELELTEYILVSGKKVVYQQVPAEPYHQGLAAFVGEGPASAFTTMWEAIDAVGCKPTQIPAQDWH